MNKKPFFERLVDIYKKTHQEPDWEKILNSRKKEQKNDDKTRKVQ